MTTKIGGNEMDQSKALQKLRSARDSGYLVYARDEEITMLRQQFETLITTIQFGPDHFCKTGSKKVGNEYIDVLYPQKHAQNQIAEACGVSFTENCGTKERGVFSKLQIIKQDGFFIVDGDYSIIGWAQGTRLKPDGQLRTSGVCEYEYSISDRCNLDFTSKYPPKTLQEARRKLLEQKKFATRKADTGAKLAVIRELANIPTGFVATDIKKPMVFTQIIESNEYKHDLVLAAMQTPEGRNKVIDAALGTTTKLFGGQETPEKYPEKLAEQENDIVDETNGHFVDESENQPIEPEIPFAENKESDAVVELKNQLLDWMTIGEFDKSKEDKDNVQRLLNDDEVPEKELERVVEWIRKRRAARRSTENK